MDKKQIMESVKILEYASREEILKFKLACKSSEFSDDQIDYLFLNFTLEDKKEIAEIVNILRQYRIVIYNKYNNQIKQINQ